MDLAALTVPQLKELCRARGLRVGGKKSDLIARLAVAAGDAGGKPAVAVGSPPVPATPEASRKADGARVQTLDVLDQPTSESGTPLRNRNQKTGVQTPPATITGRACLPASTRATPAVTSRNSAHPSKKKSKKGDDTALTGHSLAGIAEDVCSPIGPPAKSSSPATRPLAATPSSLSSLVSPKSTQNVKHVKAAGKTASKLASVVRTKSVFASPLTSKSSTTRECAPHKASSKFTAPIKLVRPLKVLPSTFTPLVPVIRPGTSLSVRTSLTPTRLPSRVPTPPVLSSFLSRTTVPFTLVTANTGFSRHSSKYRELLSTLAAFQSAVANKVIVMQLQRVQAGDASLETLYTGTDWVLTNVHTRQGCVFAVAEFAREIRATGRKKTSYVLVCARSGNCVCELPKATGNELLSQNPYPTSPTRLFTQTGFLSASTAAKVLINGMDDERTGSGLSYSERRVIRITSHHFSQKSPEQTRCTEESLEKCEEQLIPQYEGSGNEDDWDISQALFHSDDNDPDRKQWHTLALLVVGRFIGAHASFGVYAGAQIEGVTLGNVFPQQPHAPTVGEETQRACPPAATTCITPGAVYVNSKLDPRLAVVHFRGRTESDAHRDAIVLVATGMEVGVADLHEIDGKDRSLMPLGEDEGVRRAWREVLNCDAEGRPRWHSTAGARANVLAEKI